jgi:hypothetical protein
VERALTVEESDEAGSIDVCLTLLSPPVDLLRTVISIDAEGKWKEGGEREQ